jgi:hypothetical protein
MNHKSTFVLMLVSVGLSGLAGVARAADETPTIKVMLDIPTVGWNGKTNGSPALDTRYPGSQHFYVVLENVSAKPVFLAEGNDEIFGLSFEITTSDNRKITVHHRQEEYTKYVEGEFVVPPGQAKVVEIYYERDWETFPFPQPGNRANSATEVTIRALYEMKPPTENMAQNPLGRCWTGKVASDPLKIDLIYNP